MSLQHLGITHHTQDRDYTFFGNTVTVAMCGLAVFSGLIIRYTHRYKWIQIFGVSLRCM
jgi:hypothetical protein